MGSWDWDLVKTSGYGTKANARIFGVDAATFRPNPQTVRPLVDPQDIQRLTEMIADFAAVIAGYQTSFGSGGGRVMRGVSDGGAYSGRERASGAGERRHIDITERKEAKAPRICGARSRSPCPQRAGGSSRSCG